MVPMENQPKAFQQLPPKKEKYAFNPSKGFSSICSPEKIVKLVNKLIDEQKVLVEQMGFGGVLRIKFENFSKDLCRLLVLEFSRVNRYIQYHSSCYIYKLSDLVQEFKDDVDNPWKLEAVKEVGFGGLLQFQLQRVPKDLIQHLIDNFNGYSNVQKVGSDKYLLTKFDVFDMFMILVSEGEVIEVTPTGRARYIENQLRATWKADFDCTGEIPLKRLSARMIGLQDVGEESDFKRYFVMFAVCSLLAPSSRSIVDFAVCRTLENVDEIPKLDCCGFVMSRLSTSAMNYQRSMSSFNACIHVLMLAFLYRFPLKGMSESLELPLYKHWTSEKLIARASDVAKAGFDWLVMSRVVFPLTRPSSVLGGSVRPFIQIVLPGGVLGDNEIEVEGLGFPPLDVATMKFQRLVMLATDEYVMRLARLSEPLVSQQQIPSQNPSQPGSEHNSSQQPGAVRWSSHV